ncbi:MAG: T9SS type A sorting domain-containing protein [Elusimicrobiota bacterium]
MRPRLRALAAVFALAAVLFAPKPAHATFNLTIAPLTNTFTWLAVTDPSSTTAKVTYFVLYKYGANGNPLSGGTTIATVFDGLSISLGGHSLGSFCIVVRSSSAASGIFDNSTTQCHSYLHAAGGGNLEGVNRTDGNGTQIGMNQQWNFGYFLDDDSLVDLQIFPPGTGVASDTSGFLNVTGNPAPVKVLLSSTPRSGELVDGSFQNSERWDSRNSSGATVANGLYIARFIVPHPLLPQTTRYIGIFTVPVDIIRITNFGTTGISPTASLANINYTLTGDATVRIVVAKSGRSFTFDTNGDVVPICPAGAVGCVAASGTVGTDISTLSVVQTIIFNKRAGSYAETWNGTDSQGVAVTTGIYSVAISAIDGFGNRAIAFPSGGNDGPIAGTIPVERSASQTATDTTAPSITAIAVAGTNISLSGGTSVNIGFTSLAITLNEVGGTGSNLSSVALTAPAGGVAGGSVSSSSNTVTYSTATAQTSTGTYTITVTAKDQLGNASAQQTYTFVATTDTVAPNIASIQVSGSSISLVGATSLSAAFSAIAVELNEPSGTGLYVSTVTLTGPAGAVAGSLSISSNVLTFTATASQSSTGTYTITVTARDTNGNTTAATPYAFTFATTSGSPGAQTPEEFKASIKTYPNPVRRAPLSVDFTLGASANVDFDVFNILGERLYHKTVSYTAGAQTYTWNLLNDSSARVGNGVYLFRITTNDGSQTLKVVKKVMVIQ